MTSYINQSIARQLIADQIAFAESARVARELRQARRAQRRARRNARRAQGGPSNHSLYAPGRVGLAGVR